MNGMSLHPYPKGATTGCQISIPPFDMTSHPITSLPCTDRIRRKMVMVPDHIHDQKIVEDKRKTSNERTSNDRRTVFQSHKIDDEASSKTHLDRLMHTVVASEFKIFFHRKTRCRNTIFSPKTPEVFPVQTIVFQNPVLRINHGVNNDVSTVLLSSYNKRNNNRTKTKQNKTNTRTHTRPKTKPNVTQSESTRKQRPTVSANPHLHVEGRRMKKRK